MNNFPKIEGLKWLSNDAPDLVSINVILQSTVYSNLGISGMKPPETECEYYLDLSLLAGIRDWYDEASSDKPSKTECLADFNGVASTVLLITRANLLKAWLFYKKYKSTTTK